MTDEQRQEIMRAQDESMRATSKEEMARRQLEAADGMRQRGPLTSVEQEAMNNSWRHCPDAMPAAQLPPKPKPTLWTRLKRWVRA